MLSITHRSRAGQTDAMREVWLKRGRRNVRGEDGVHLVHETVTGLSGGRVDALERVARHRNLAHAHWRVLLHRLVNGGRHSGNVARGHITER